VTHDFYIRGIERLDKPWGYCETVFTQSAHGVRNATDPYKLKVLFIEKGKEIPTQRHLDRNETLTVLEGNPVIKRGVIDYVLSAGESIVISKHMGYSIKADEGDVLISEAQTGNCLND